MRVGVGRSVIGEVCEKESDDCGCRRVGVLGSVLCVRERLGIAHLLTYVCRGCTCAVDVLHSAMYIRLAILECLAT